MTTWTLLEWLFQSGVRAPTALLANAAISVRGSDGRRFSVDPDGAWVNRQDRATFVSPTIHAKRYDTIKATLLDYWCHTYTPKPGDMVFDIGAGIGDEAVIFSHLVSPGGHVYSAEAHPETYWHLRRTAESSSLANVELLPFAIMDKDGSVSISSGEAHLANSVMDGGEILVPARSVASYCSEMGLSKIDFLKMNIEGAESLAVHGFGSVQISHLAIACHDFIAETGRSDIFRTKDVVRQFLVEAGYVVTERTDHPVPWIRDTLYGDTRQIR